VRHIYYEHLFYAVACSLCRRSEAPLCVSCKLTRLEKSPNVMDTEQAVIDGTPTVSFNAL
jgi:predicted metal-binding protein